MTELQFQKMEYIQRNRKYIRRTEKLDENGVKIPGTGKKTKGVKRGVLIAGINPDGKLIIGWSLCHKNDLYDYIGGEWVSHIDRKGCVCGSKYINGYHTDGFGKMLAVKRALKWADYQYIYINGKNTVFDTSDVDPKNTVFVPSSIEKQLIVFVNQCMKYYKDKHFPAWVLQLDLVKPV